MTFTPLAFVNIGGGNIVCVSKVKYITLPKTAPGFRLVKIAKKDGRFVDATCGRITKSLIILDDGTVIACYFTPTTIMTRFRRAVSEFTDDNIDATKYAGDWRENLKTRLGLKALEAAEALEEEDDMPPEDEEEEPIEDDAEADDSEIMDYERDTEPYHEEEHFGSTISLLDLAKDDGDGNDSNDDGNDDGNDEDGDA